MHRGQLVRSSLLILAIGMAAVAQTPTALPSYRARLLGVFSAQTGDPIQGAEVIDLFSKTKALTTATGTVTLAFLPEGGSMVRVQKIGYEPFTQIIPITPEDTVPATVLLRPVAVRLPGVVTRDSSPRYISPGLQAFEERRRAGFGKFITEAELRKNDSHRMTSMMRALGAKVACSTRTPIRCVTVTTRTGSSCELEVFRDGMRLNREDRDIEKIPVNEIGGVEVYFGPATIPPLYNMTGSACGVILLWSRER